MIRRSTILSNVFENHFKTRSVRLYLKKDYELESLFKELELNNISYAVLRWFENLPHVDDGEDIDMLVSSKHLDKVLKYFTAFEKAGGQKFDLYPSGYHLSMNYRNLSYYPEVLADKILDEAIVYNGLCKVPNSNYYPLSFIFHVLFHKACKSSLTYNGVDRSIKAEHDYPSILKGLNVGDISSLSNAYGYLNENDFLPSIDTAKKYADSAQSNDLKKLILLQERKTTESITATGESVMFVVRENLLNYPDLYN
ncbi:hypothetical protein RCJ22_10500, partial [Vibrio sp. FNV 38]|nr:hypothetical protein [Vibrio sp. FNV 38]